MVRVLAIWQCRCCTITVASSAHPSATASAGLVRDLSNEQSIWTLKDESGERIEIPFKLAFCSNDWATLFRVAVAGVGIVALPAHVCRKEVSSGALEHVLHGWRADHATLTLLQPSRRGTLAAVRAFVDFILKELPIAIV
jgi:DNA-binding transcriptional LysR family regulator